MDISPIIISLKTATVSMVFTFLLGLFIARAIVKIKSEKIKMILALVNLKPENSEKNQIKKDLNILSNSELRTILFALISYLFKAGRYKFVWGIIGTGLAYQAYQMWNKSTKKEDSDSTTKVKAETSVNEKDKDITLDEIKELLWYGTRW